MGLSSLEKNFQRTLEGWIHFTHLNECFKPFIMYKAHFIILQTAERKFIEMGMGGLHIFFHLLDFLCMYVCNE